MREGIRVVSEGGSLHRQEVGSGDASTGGTSGPLRDIERILYFEAFVVVDPGMTQLERGQLLSDEMYLDAIDNSSNLTGRSANWLFPRAGWMPKCWIFYLAGR